MNKPNGQKESSNEKPYQSETVTLNNNSATSPLQYNIVNNCQQYLAKDALSPLSMASSNVNGNSSSNGSNSMGLSSASSTSSASSCASGINSADNNANNYFQAFNAFKTVDMNNNSNGVSTGANQHSSMNQYHQQLQQQQQQQQNNNLVNAYSMLNNPYLNGAALVGNGAPSLSPHNATNANLLASLNAAAMAAGFGGFIGINAPTNNSNPNFANSNQINSFNNANMHLANQSAVNQSNSNNNSNNGNMSTNNLLAGGAPSGINLNDEHQVYEYLHQLLDEKEKLKELFNEPFNIMLPISAKLLDEGKSKAFSNTFIKQISWFKCPH